MSQPQWPFVCASCGQHYAAFLVYVHWGRDQQFYGSCTKCGPNLPDFLDNYDRKRADDVYHTVLRPVPESYNPKTNPYPSATNQSPATLPATENTI